MADHRKCLKFAINFTFSYINRCKNIKFRQSSLMVQMHLKVKNLLEIRNYINFIESHRINFCEQCKKYTK